MFSATSPASTARMYEVNKHLQPLMRAVGTLASDSIRANPHNEAGMSIAFDSIRGICDVAEEIYRKGGIGPVVVEKDDCPV